AVQIYMRQSRAGNPLVTAGAIRDPDFLENLTRYNNGYMVFKHLRSTPTYLMRQRKKVVAMVRELGTCNFFITLSAAETKWMELLQMLVKIVKGDDKTEEEMVRLTAEERAELIRSDPVTCVQHFNHRYRALLTCLFQKEGGIFDKPVTEYFS